MPRNPDCFVPLARVLDAMGCLPLHWVFIITHGKPQTMTEAINNPTDTVRVRFAPSPTGYLHVGGARTALFNWLYARKHHGTMICVSRIPMRNATSPNSSKALSTAEMARRQLGRRPILPVAANSTLHRRSQRRFLRMAAHSSAIALRNDTGAAIMPKKARKSPRCAAWFAALAAMASLRHPAPSRDPIQGADGGTTKFFDVVFGERDFANDEIEDFVLLRSGKDGEDFGQAMYQMSVVVDDIDMRITHMIRGADHISNTPKQVLIYRALGVEPPVFAHVPLILARTNASRSATAPRM